MLAKHYGWEPRFEAVSYNPYLEDYYNDIQRWSFPLEVYFLKERFRDILDINRTEHCIIQDRSIFEGVHVFVANNKAQGNLSDRDYETYMELFEHMMSMVRMPELMIYLRASIPHLVSNIQKRGRDYEQQIQIDYLRGLNKRYEEFITEKYTGRVLVIDVDNMDFQHNREDFAQIVNKVNERLFSMFPELDPPTP